MVKLAILLLQCSPPLGCDKIKVRGHKCSFRVKLTMRLGFVDCWFVEILGNHNYYMEDGTPSDVASMMADYEVKSSDGEDNSSVRSSPLVLTDSIVPQISPAAIGNPNGLSLTPTFPVSSPSPHPHANTMMLAPAHCPLNVPVFPESYLMTMARHAAANVGLANGFGGGNVMKSPAISPYNSLALKRDNCRLGSMVMNDMINGRFPQSPIISPFGLFPPSPMLSTTRPSSLSPHYYQPARANQRSPANSSHSRRHSPDPCSDDVIDLSTSSVVNANIKDKEEIIEDNLPQDTTLPNSLSSFSSKSPSLNGDRSSSFMNESDSTPLFSKNQEDCSFSDTFHTKIKPVNVSISDYITSSLVSPSSKEKSTTNSKFSSTMTLPLLPLLPTNVSSSSNKLAMPYLNGRPRKSSQQKLSPHSVTSNNHTRLAIKKEENEVFNGNSCYPVNGFQKVDNNENDLEDLNQYPEDGCPSESQSDGELDKVDTLFLGFYATICILSRPNPIPFPSHPLP